MSSHYESEGITPPDVGSFLSGTAAAAQSGNTAWARNLAREVTRVVRQASERAPRSQQIHLGPSELGTLCDRQIVGKLVGEPKTNHVVDPWPSVVGTAVHAWLADAFTLDNTLSGRFRWSTEIRVVPHPDHAGTADLYDWIEQSVDDHKVLGESSMAKVRSAKGPSLRYQVQLLIYALGNMLAGRPVKRVAIIAYPRTGSTLDGIYVWERPMDADAAALLAWVFEATARRKELAAKVTMGQLKLTDITRVPDHDECYFCPFYRPDSVDRPDEHGCPGTVH